MNTILHTYAKQLIKFAMDNDAATIVLKQNKTEAKCNNTLLENWGYYSLKTKLEYKAKLNGIEIIEENLAKEKQK